ncbi:MAG TPA: cobyric acid synthase [Candidatus Tectomicrobia bacterium]|nr:cobyric acid synthase [Candidatus Tectomicrobia bacterium]
MPGKPIMVQGTGSYVGKSITVTALCRIFTRRGYRTAPFKAQNMALNSYVTADGGEIGRSTAEQAAAAGIAPTVDMNPILLKPNSEVGSQVILRGKPIGNYPASAYWQLKPTLFDIVQTSLRTMLDDYEVVVIEGAGSPAEINLKTHDLVNMRVARWAQAPVLLVGDISLGGVFAWLYGTLTLLPAEERALVRATLINKFRGDAKLLGDGLQQLEQLTGIPVLGVVPDLGDLGIGEEDTVPTSRFGNWSHDGTLLRIGVIHYPYRSNFTDFDRFFHEPGVEVRYLTDAALLQGCHVIFLPGTKQTMADLEWLRQRGFETAIRQRVEAGAFLVGLCGGYQMLGERLEDPDGVESALAEAPGLGFLPIATRFNQEKALYQVEAVHEETGLPVHGYEIHMGESRPLRTIRPFVRIRRRNGRGVELQDGAAAGHGRVWGCYVHGLFDDPDFRRQFLNEVRAAFGLATPVGSGPGITSPYDRLADAFERHLDMQMLWTILESGV